ncbi:MAG TPA: adenylate/guanylate cyclase domain-containing protein [Bradyrhizobium sp.]|nr:adenylate/guanylate cyclase domain-containing protein [Bradyrhizobium sp.]
MDVEGYSGLVEADETATLRAVRCTFEELVLPTIGDFGGHIFKTVGDGLLAEFASPVNAVKWTAQFQRALAARHHDGEPQLRVRAGIALGDVIVTDHDRFGDGVNVAARVQELSPPGGMAISRGVFEYLTGKTDLYLTDIGEQRLKGLSQLQRVWIWNPRMISVTPPRRIAVPDPATHPSIAVLPFRNLSGDPSRDLLVEGLLDEITASLSRVKEFLVIARHSAAVYRGNALDLKAVAAELGVRYILKGSVQFAGMRMRMSVQLVDVDTSLQIWNDKIEAQVDDLFDVQDQVAERVSGALHPTIRKAEVERSRRKAPENMAAYDLVMCAMPHLWAHRRIENEQAISLINQALTLEPHNGRAAAVGAWAHAQHIAYNWTDHVAEQRAKGKALLDMALGRIDDDPLALTATASAIMLIDGALDRANTLIDRAIDIDVNHAWAWTRRGFSRVYAGQPDEGFACFERSGRLSPRDPFSFNSVIGIGLAHFASGRPVEAARWTKRALAEKPGINWPLRDLAAFLGWAGEAEEASRALSEFLLERPHVTSTAVIRDALHFMNPDLLDRYIAGLINAGLPNASLRNLVSL